MMPSYIVAPVPPSWCHCSSSHDHEHVKPFPQFSGVLGILELFAGCAAGMWEERRVRPVKHLGGCGSPRKCVKMGSRG